MKMTSFLSHIAALLLSVCTVLSFLFVFPPSPQTESVKFASSLGAGWNLGNTFDAWRIPEPDDTETCWGNPKTTKELISLIKQSGFETVRIPVTWFQHLDSDGNIDSEWLDRVNEVVGWVLDCGMNAVLNVQHDDQDWLIANSENEERACKTFASIWAQIAGRFKDYDERLIFETMNEPRVVGAQDEWEGNDEGRAVVNRLNLAALRAIRESGGKNADRYVFITGYAASDLEENFTAIEIPDDSRVMVSLHYYPGTAHRSEFADCEKKLTFEQRRNIYKKLRAFYNAFSKKGVGVCITEFGWTDREHIDNLAEKADYLVSTAKRFGFCCFVWDNGLDFCVIDRENLAVAYPAYAEAITGNNK